ncbi:low-density lipoprotein receptor-related protein 1 isoform X2 [Dendroctonus ponderosae]|uniref:low-density lipoprotein receptor-related protein 1 isoform X2 n=1 Tax=Dendroctonus ponderosae TaxID=77166 RepID=UPI002036319E|nr:low-density lipoprotein receptor-related protein 1 isoform X2 [Dendroctonus ponderosae]
MWSLRKYTITIRVKGKSQNMSVSTISREMYQNGFNKNVMIKRDMFGHKWILKINEQKSQDPKKKNRLKLMLLIYVSVFFSTILALCCGIIFSLDYNIFRPENKNTPHANINNTTVKSSNMLLGNNNQMNETKTDYITKATDKESNSSINSISSREDSKELIRPYCVNCTEDEVCIKTAETKKPTCLPMTDKRDTTGCGGLCKINEEYCKLLDKTIKVYQCLALNNRLKCPENTFNCGNMCVSMDKRCNGQIDCANMMDEKNCVCELETHFQCGNQTSCLDKVKLCNGKVDCWDKSDEVQCQKDVFCQKNHVPCSNGQCIPKEKMCDSVFDCVDKTDEPFWCQQIRNT